MISYKELRQQLTDEQIKEILSQFDVDPVEEDADKIIFPTCCHNLTGGSPKLYYFKDSKLFFCYTECGGPFDIFTLLQKMSALRGNELTLRQAVDLCNLDTDQLKHVQVDQGIFDDIRYMQELNDTYIPDIQNVDFKFYNTSILRKYTFDYLGLMSWIEEGISMEALQKFNIKYDNFRNVIVIPNFDYDGHLIGLRGRFLNPEDVAKGKYRPIYDNGILYNHPTGRTFYGIYENHKNIERKHTCIIFEGKR